MFCAFLPGRAVISLRGNEAASFLQGLISNDINKLGEDNGLYAALLSPQGKFLHDFLITRWQDKLLLDVSAKRAADLLARLKIYKLRSQVDIALETDLEVGASWGGAAPSLSEYKIYSDPRLPALGFRVIGRNNHKSSFTPMPAQEYEWMRLKLGVPATEDMIIDKSLLLECGFEELHGVDFNKGCYVGQEVTARSKFRGKVRKSFYKLEGGNDLPPPGTPVVAGKSEIGEMRSSLANAGLAIINNDELINARQNNMEFLCGGKHVVIDALGWANNI